MIQVIKFDGIWKDWVSVDNLNNESGWIYVRGVSGPFLVEDCFLNQHGGSFYWGALMWGSAQFRFIHSKSKFRFQSFITISIRCIYIVFEFILNVWFATTLPVSFVVLEYCCWTNIRNCETTKRKTWQTIITIIIPRINIDTLSRCSQSNNA